MGQGDTAPSPGWCADGRLALRRPHPGYGQRGGGSSGHRTEWEGSSETRPPLTCEGEESGTARGVPASPVLPALGVTLTRASGSPRLAERSRRSCGRLRVGLQRLRAPLSGLPGAVETPFAQAWIRGARRKPATGRGVLPSLPSSPRGQVAPACQFTRSLPPASWTMGFPEQRDPTWKPGPAERLPDDPRPRRGAGGLRLLLSRNPTA